MIKEKYEATTGKIAQAGTHAGFSNQRLEKNMGEMVKLDEYRSIVRKIMYYSTKLAPELSNVARELATHLFNPGQEH